MGGGEGGGGRCVRELLLVDWVHFVFAGKSCSSIKGLSV